MNRRHLVLVLAGSLALSSSTLAMAEGKSKQSRERHLAHGKVLPLNSTSTSHTPITLSATSGIVKFDTSTAVPQFQFDTSTATSHIDLESDDDASKVDSGRKGHHEEGSSTGDDD